MHLAMQNYKICFSLIIRFSFVSTMILLSSGKPFCTADKPLLFSALLKCSFSLLFIQVTIHTIISSVSSPSQPIIISMAVLLYVADYLCFTNLVLSVFTSYIALPSPSPQPFFPLFPTFNTAQHTVQYNMLCKSFCAININFWECDPCNTVE